MQCKISGRETVQISLLHIWVTQKSDILHSHFTTTKDCVFMHSYLSVPKIDVSNFKTWKISSKFWFWDFPSNAGHLFACVARDHMSKCESVFIFIHVHWYIHNMNPDDLASRKILQHSPSCAVAAFLGCIGNNAACTARTRYLSICLH